MVAWRGLFLTTASRSKGSFALALKSDRKPPYAYRGVEPTKPAIDICVRLHLYPYSNRGTFVFSHIVRHSRVGEYDGKLHQSRMAQ